MRISAAFLALAVLHGVAGADCPATDAAARDAVTAPIFQRLAASRTEDAGMELASQIWQIWAMAPDARAQEMLDKGMERIRWGSFGDAEARLTQLIDYCPDYPEGWNQRAFARFLALDYDGALQDLDRTLVLEPRHFGALAGRGLTFLSQGDKEQGFAELRAAVAVHPWMNERHLLPPEQDL